MYMTDHVGDANPVYFFKAAESLELPDYLMSTPMLSQEDVAPLPSYSFADRNNRLFPIHTKEATLMSAMCFYGRQYRDPQIEQGITKAAASHDVSELVESFKTLFHVQIKQAAAPEPRYALAYNDGTQVRYYFPIDGETELCQSARKLTKAAKDMRLPLAFVKTAAEAMCDRAQELGLVPEATLPAEVVNLGTVRIVDFEAAKEAAALRQEFAGVDGESLALYYDTIESAKVAYQAGESIQDYIDVIEILDQAHNVKYSHLLADPYRMFYSGPSVSDVQKFANEVVFVGEIAVPTEVLAATPDNRIEDWFDAPNASAIKRARDLATKSAAASTQALAGIGADNEQALLKLLLQLNT